MRSGALLRVPEDWDRRVTERTAWASLRGGTGASDAPRVVNKSFIIPGIAPNHTPEAVPVTVAARPTVLCHGRSIRAISSLVPSSLGQTKRHACGYETIPPHSRRAILHTYCE